MRRKSMLAWNSAQFVSTVKLTSVCLIHTFLYFLVHDLICSPKRFRHRTAPWTTKLSTSTGYWKGVWYAKDVIYQLYEKSPLIRERHMAFGDIGAERAPRNSAARRPHLAAILWRKVANSRPEPSSREKSRNTSADLQRADSACGDALQCSGTGSPTSTPSRPRRGGL